MSSSFKDLISITSETRLEEFGLDALKVVVNVDKKARVAVGMEF